MKDFRYGRSTIPMISVLESPTDLENNMNTDIYVFMFNIFVVSFRCGDDEMNPRRSLATVPTTYETFFPDL